MALKSITVLVCAYTEKRWDELVRSIQSIQDQTLKPAQIILVIDHNEKLYERARQQFTGVLVVQNTQQQGLSGARNSGTPLATGEIVAFIDEDAVAAPDWLATLERAYYDPNVLGAGGLIRPLWVDEKPGWFPEEFNWVVGCTYKGVPEQTAVIRNMIGCNMSFRREAFEQVGGFRTNMGRIGTIPLGCEETEFCIRLKQHWPQTCFVYEPQAKVQHRVPVSRARFSYFWARCYAEGLSKALVAQFVGAGDGLSSERTYTFKTLPEGVFRGLGNFIRGDWPGLGRASAIVIGLAVTTIGYLVGRVSQPSLKLNEN